MFIAKRTNRGPRPIPFLEIISGKNSILKKLPKKKFNLKRKLCLPDPFIIRSNYILFQQTIQGFGG
jgi:hypothetical protein